MVRNLGKGWAGSMGRSKKNERAWISAAKYLLYAQRVHENEISTMAMPF